MPIVGLRWRLCPALLASLIGFKLAYSAHFALPLPGNDIVGEPYSVAATEQQTLLDIAREHGIGQEEIIIANPQVDRWMPGAGTLVTIPNQHVLPDAPRSGLVLNLPEMRLYLFQDDPQGFGDTVVTYPVSVGRMDWKTPLGTTKVIKKQRRPSWRPPESVKQEAKAQGEPPLPDVVPPGPDNPLGEYALRLALPGYLIHGTNKPWGVGMRVTHGCVRLLPEHIAELFTRVPVGMPVHIVNQPVKFGWYGDTLYIEVHPPLDEDATANADLLRFALEHTYAILERRPVRLRGAALRQAVANKQGIPIAISQGAGIPLDNPIFR
jgi:L,D-transpeptidase ErfK/SrfK